MGLTFGVSDIAVDSFTTLEAVPSSRRPSTIRPRHTSRRSSGTSRMPTPQSEDTTKPSKPSSEAKEACDVLHLSTDATPIPLQSGVRLPNTQDCRIEGYLAHRKLSSERRMFTGRGMIQVYLIIRGRSPPVMCGSMDRVQARSVGKSIRYHVYYGLVLDTLSRPLTHSSTRQLPNAVKCVLVCMICLSQSQDLT